jgi:hypothetical protein
MYMPWSNDSLKQATQIVRQLSILSERLQDNFSVTPLELMQAKQQLKELQSLGEVPGVAEACKKYKVLLNATWSPTEVVLDYKPRTKSDCGFLAYSP